MVESPIGLPQAAIALFGSGPKSEELGLSKCLPGYP